MRRTLAVSDISVDYRLDTGQRIRSISNVTLDVAPGEVVAVVGESGCGKSTVAKAVAGLVELASGEVRFNDERVRPLRLRRRRVSQRRLQTVFQDPGASRNPRRRIGTQLRDARQLATVDDDQAPSIASLLAAMELDDDVLDRYPHQLSGGQKQRVCIARALAAAPDCIVADEPVAALDASHQGRVAQLLVDEVRNRGAAMLFISHDLGIVRSVADRVAVLYLGGVVETGPVRAVFGDPQHPYTQLLLSSRPSIERIGELPAAPVGEVPDIANPPSGCHFHPRCRYATATCEQQSPPVSVNEPSHAAACWLLDPSHDTNGQR